MLLQALQLPAGMGIEVGLAGPAPVAAPYHLLPSRIRQASSKRRPGLAASFCARRALSRAGYAGSDPLKTETDGLPSWPEGWSGSVGWADIGAVAVVAPVDPQHWLGVDLSVPLSELQCRWLGPLLASRAEREVLSSRCSASLSLLYSAKEALQRAFQPMLGQVLDYQAIRCIGIDGDWLWFEPVAAIGPHWPPARRLRVRYLASAEMVLTVATSRQQLG